MLVGTDIKEFASKEIRKLTADFIFSYFPGKDIAFEKIAAFFKVPYQRPEPIEPQRPRTNSASDKFKHRP